MTRLRSFWQAALARLRSSAGGFTLVELLVTIAISGVIVLVIAAAFAGGSRASMDANTRLRESHDAQMLNAYFVADAEGISGFSQTAPASASGVPAGSTAVATFSWLDASTVTKSAYYYKTTPVGGVSQLQRRWCSNGAAVGTDVVLGRTIVSTSVTCDPACSGIPTGLGVTVGESSGFNYTVQVAPRSAAPTNTYAAAPTVRSITRASANPSNATQVFYTVAFSEAVTGVNIGSNSDFFLNPTVSGASIAQLIGGGSSSTYTVVVNIGSATAGSIGLNVANDGTIKDRTSQALSGNFTGDTYTVDKVPPTLSSIALAGPSPVSTGPLSWTVTFSEPVSNVAASNFSLATSGTGGTAPTITSVAPSGTAPTATWTVTADTTGTTGANGATIALKLASKGTIQDAATNALGGSVPVTGAAFTYDTTKPNVTSISDATGQADPTRTLPVNVKVTFDEPVSGFTAGGVTVSGTAPGTKTVTVTPATGPSTTYNVAVDGATGAGTIVVQVNPGAAQDAAGNASAASSLTDQVSYDPNLALPPYAFDIQGQPASPASNKPSSGDKILYTFDQTMSPGSIKSAWDGTSTAVTARFTRSSGNSTQLAVVSGSTTLNLGTVSLGDQSGQRYMSSGTIDVTATMAMTTVSGRSVVTLTLTASSSSFTADSSSTSLQWTPSSAAKSTAGLAMTTTPVTQAGGPKQNF